MTHSIRIPIRISLSLPLFAIAGLAAVMCKLLGVAPFAAASWWIVTLPWWIGFAVLFGAAGLALGAFIICVAVMVAGWVLVKLFAPAFRWFNRRKLRRVIRKERLASSRAW